MTDMNADFYDCILKGASTSRAGAVEGGNREKSLEVGKDRAYAPRSMIIREVHIAEHGYTGVCAQDARGTVTALDYTVGTTKIAGEGSKRK